MILEPPAEPNAAKGLPSLSKIVGVMLLRGRLNGATSLAPMLPVAKSKVGGQLKSVSSLLSKKP